MDVILYGIHQQAIDLEQLKQLKELSAKTYAAAFLYVAKLSSHQNQLVWRMTENNRLYI